MNSRRICRKPGKWCQDLWLGPNIPHTLGDGMTAVRHTPPQIISLMEHYIHFCSRCWIFQQTAGPHGSPSCHLVLSNFPFFPLFHLPSFPLVLLPLANWPLSTFWSRAWPPWGPWLAKVVPRWRPGLLLTIPWSTFPLF